MIQTRTNEVFAAIRNLEDDFPTGQISTDQTGRFPILSNRGNQYIMGMYAYDSNAILIEPMKNKSITEIIAKFTILHDRLCRADIKALYQKLDNEAPAVFKKCIQNADIDYQLVYPHIHRRNPAERVTRTFKNYFIADLSSTSPIFLMQIWCRLSPRVEMTLNMLRPSRLNPKISAYTQLSGAFDYNKIPLSPPPSSSPPRNQNVSV